MSEVKQGLYYTESHEYVRIEDDYGYVGITDYAQQIGLGSKKYHLINLDK